MTSFDDLPKPSPAALKRQYELTEFIRQQTIKNGPLSFADFMNLALYHPQWGYYCADTIALGKQGDFTTAPEISPLFAQCMAEQCKDLMNQLSFKYIIEFGAGSGRFAADMLAALAKHKQLPTKYYIHEISPSLRDKQRDYLNETCPQWVHRVVWVDHLPQNLNAIVIANEVLDALPVHCFQISADGTQEKCVTFQNEQLVWQTKPAAAQLTVEVDLLKKQQALPIGYESEINLQLASFIKNIANALNQGVILFSDYGYGQTEYYHPERQGGTLTCFYQHHYHHNPLIYAGLQDITAHVDFTRVADTALSYGCSLLGYTSQAAFLLGCGLLDFAAQAEKTLSAAEQFNLHQDIKILTWPTEMGERIKIMALGKNISPNIELPLPGFALSDRRRDL